MALPPQIAVPQEINEKFSVNYQPFSNKTKIKVQNIDTVKIKPFPADSAEFIFIPNLNQQRKLVLNWLLCDLML
jgi:hypothetical protein